MDACVHHRFNHRHGDAYFRHGLHAVENIFVKSRLTGRNLQLRRTGDAIHGLMKRIDYRLIRRVDAHKDGHPEDDSSYGQQPARQMLADMPPANEFQQDHE